jgi:hypothetical protein
MIEKKHFWDRNGWMETIVVIAILGIVVLYFVTGGSQKILDNQTNEVNETLASQNFSGSSCSVDAQCVIEKQFPDT